MHHAVDLDGGHGGALQRGQQHAAQALPSVTPKPRSRGSATMRALRLRVGAGLDLRLLGRMSSFQFLLDHG